MKHKRIDPLDAMENAARRMEKAAERMALKGGHRNMTRVHWMRVGVSDLRREAAEKRRREDAKT